jgi:hypothetical protein
MTLINRPDKHAVRIYTQQRAAAQRSADRPGPPSPAEIRRQLGWGLLKTSAECAR